MDSDTTTGVPNPDKPGHWLVPPWPPGANFHEVVRHFLPRWPWLGSNTTHLRAYYVGFLAALDAAPTEDRPTALERRWYAEMRDSVARCARVFQDKHAAESQPARRTAPAMRSAA